MKLIRNYIEFFKPELYPNLFVGINLFAIVSPMFIFLFFNAPSVTQGVISALLMCFAFINLILLAMYLIDKQKHQNDEYNKVLDEFDERFEH